jgi:PadR family transcriptional regulator, regulatory protein PadR
MVPGREAKLLAQLRRGSIQYCVLALLRDEDRYGFELTRTLAQADGLVTSEGTVYPLLARLRQDGLVETSWQESSQGPPRRYYRLTPDGDEALEAFTAQWRRFRDAIDGLLDEESAHGRSSRASDSDPVLPQA